MTCRDNEALERWLAQKSPEPVIEPDLPIIDPHHHLWDIRTATADQYVSVFQQKVYLCQEFTDDIRESGHNVQQTVFIETGAFYRADGPKEMRCVGETESMHGIAAMSRSGVYGDVRLCTGIIGRANLRAGAAVEAVIEAHIAASPNFRGIRGVARVLDNAFLEGYAVLARHGLSFDTYSPNSEWLVQLAELARAQPDVPIVVNHLGGWIDPGAGEDSFAIWRERVDEIARYPNVVMKLGGVQQRIGKWEPPFHMNKREEPMGSDALCELLFPYYAHAIQAFGPERCMFESNFPVDKESVGYRTLWNMFKRIAAKAELSDAEKAAVFSGTAAHVYRLPTIPPASVDTN